MRPAVISSYFKIQLILALAAAILCISCSDVSQSLSQSIERLKSECGTETPEPANPDTGNGIDLLNQYRAALNQSPVQQDPALSEGAQNHARYLLKEYSQGGRLGGMAAHSEVKSSPWYTPSGAAAAPSSVIAVLNGIGANGAPVSPSQGVNEWMSEVFHRLPLIDPGLRQGGWGSDTEGNLVAAVLQYRSASMAGNLARTNGTSAAPGTLEDYVKEAGAQQSGQLASFSTPIMFPGNRSEIVLSAYRGGEWPDPLSACHGYRVPSGLPITLELGPSAEPIRVSARSLAIDGDEVENCLVTAHTYTNSDPQ